MTYRPICDTWLLARPKLKNGARYYGSFPSGFLPRARALLGVGPDDAVLHVCSGRAGEHLFGGFGRNDRTVDIDRSLKPDFVMDVREELPPYGRTGWPAILADPPYTEDDADHYTSGRERLPQAGPLLARCLQYVRPGGRVGFLHYVFPRPPRNLLAYTVRLVAVVGVIAGYDNRMRAFSVFEKVKP
jgi:hypothetical protein